ncbi:MAG TPA: MOSC domain-containing protein [Candidatus Limnocylindrales bacterium]|jgi:MOSC domain-containing protein YiiM|nr:MOSC domain-containing protein [Candidatus Limnocylindrales bacterium]
MAHIVEILIAASPSAPMESREQIRATPGKGLEGDRYYSGIGTFSPNPHKPEYEITLIQKEHIDGFRAASTLPFTSKHARRNLVSEGIDLNSLVGKEFSVGAVRMRGIRLCEPCNYLAKSSFPEVLSGLVHKGGLRAQIISEGIVHVGDPVVCS